MQASYIRSRISYACVTLRAANEACLQTVWGLRMETRGVRIVFHPEPNQKFHSLMQGSGGSQVFGKNTFPWHLPAERWPQRGARERRWEPSGGGGWGRVTEPQVRGGKRAGPRGPPGRAGAGAGRPGQSARPAVGPAPPGPRARPRARPRTARGARPGRGAPTPRAAAAGLREWSGTCASAAAVFLRQFPTCLQRDLRTFTVSLRWRWATLGAPAGRWPGEPPPRLLCRDPSLVLDAPARLGRGSSQVFPS
ncbi:chemokine-like protein TAFA-4 isoform X2 [Mustela erminea]|uniref:chemokine-like protein TAFA-4 isoform X2 n=1 Tax=Mustela erminea TaxID=36723 RepID=UPI001386987A|nr:chemokine-like protein TAFA-4 isoform X2 [Mustela erminea]